VQKVFDGILDNLVSVNVVDHESVVQLNLLSANEADRLDHEAHLQVRVAREGLQGRHVHKLKSPLFNLYHEVAQTADLDGWVVFSELFVALGGPVGLAVV
jgi:hypothetical protein